MKGNDAPATLTAPVGSVTVGTVVAPADAGAQVVLVVAPWAVEDVDAGTVEVVDEVVDVGALVDEVDDVDEVVDDVVDELDVLDVLDVLEVAPPLVVADDGADVLDEDVVEPAEQWAAVVEVLAVAARTVVVVAPWMVVLVVDDVLEVVEVLDVLDVVLDVLVEEVLDVEVVEVGAVELVLDVDDVVGELWLKLISAKTWKAPPKLLWSAPMYSTQEWVESQLMLDGVTVGPGTT